MKLYNLNKIFFWSMIFTPLFGSILLYLNAKEMKINSIIENENKWLWYNIIAFFLNLIVPFFIVIFFIFWWKYSLKNQETYIKNNFFKFEEKSFVKPLSISFSILFIFIFSIAFFLKEQITSNNHNVYKNLTEHFKTLKSFEK